jgi:UDP-glucose 4-epimerase
MGAKRTDLMKATAALLRQVPIELVREKAADRNTENNPRVLMLTVCTGAAFNDIHHITGEYHQQYADEHGYEYRVLTAPRRAGDPAALVADPRLAAARLGFVTRQSEIDRIIAHAATWFGHEVRHAATA